MDIEEQAPATFGEQAETRTGTGSYREALEAGKTTEQEPAVSVSRL
jgi:hypothetical protein